MAAKPPRDDFRLNEPKPRVPGGSRRESVRVDRAGVREIARRERLNQLLLAHDPDVAEQNRAKITMDDLELLRAIAQEGAISGTPPALRRNAIACLSRWPTPENLNVLVQLARQGEDFYVRGAALAALGETGLRTVAPILADGLAAREPVEAAGAERGVVALGRAIGASALRAALGTTQRPKAVLDRVDRALARISEARPSRAARRRRTAADSTKA